MVATSSRTFYEGRETLLFSRLDHDDGDAIRHADPIIDLPQCRVAIEKCPTHATIATAEDTVTGGIRFNLNFRYKLLASI